MARVILSEAKEAMLGSQLLASLRMTLYRCPFSANTIRRNHLHFVALRLPAVTPFLLFPKLTTR